MARLPFISADCGIAVIACGNGFFAGASAGAALSFKSDIFFDSSSSRLSPAFPLRLCNRSAGASDAATSGMASICGAAIGCGAAPAGAPRVVGHKRSQAASVPSPDPSAARPTTCAMTRSTWGMPGSEAVTCDVPACVSRRSPRGAPAATPLEKAGAWQGLTSLSEWVSPRHPCGRL